MPLNLKIGNFTRATKQVSEFVGQEWKSIGKAAAHRALVGAGIGAVSGGALAAVNHDSIGQGVIKGALVGGAIGGGIGAWKEGGVGNVAKAGWKGTDNVVSKLEEEAARGGRTFRRGYGAGNLRYSSAAPEAAAGTTSGATGPIIGRSPYSARVGRAFANANPSAEGAEMLAAQNAVSKLRFKGEGDYAAYQTATTYVAPNKFQGIDMPYQE